MSIITQNVKSVKSNLANGNPYGERVLLVGAVKMQSVESVNEAIDAGLDAVAENKAQDFRDKNELWKECPRHFIGHLQTNKVKYLVGKVELFHSCDRDELANELCGIEESNDILILSTEFGEKSFRLKDVNGVKVVSGNGEVTDILDTILNLLKNQKEN